MPHATEADIAPAAPPPQHGMASEADVLPEQSFGAGLSEYGHQMGGLFESLWNKAKGAVGALLPDDPSKAAVEVPIRVLAGAADALHSHIKNLQGLQDKAEQSLAKGDIADFLGHMQALSVEGVVPGIGQAADAAKAKWDAGDKVGATADAAALTSQALLGAKAGDLAKAGLNAGAYTVAGARAAAPGVIGGLAKAGVGEVLAKVPGMELPARFGLQYPAIRQVAKALEKGAAAGRAAIAPEAAAATEAAAPRPVRASKAPTATAPPTAPAPEAPPTAPGKTAADLLNEEMPPTAAAEPTLAGGTTVEDIGKGLGIKDWKSATPEDKAMAQGVFDRLKAAESGGAPTPAQAAPSAYTPRPPEYYGVKPAEAPPTNPTPSAPAPAQPASAAAPTTETVETPPQKPAEIPQKPEIPFEAVRKTGPGDALEGVGGGVGPGFTVYKVPTEKLVPTEDISGMPEKMADVAKYAEKLKAGSEPPALFGHYDPDTGNVVVTSGSRRMMAAQQAGAPDVPVAIPKAAPGAEETLGVKPEPPQPKPASGAVKANAQAKADRFVKAIRQFNSDNPGMKFTADDLAVADDADKSMLTRGLQQGGYIKNTETFTDTSFPYILQKLKEAETAARQTIKPPAGFSMGSMKQYPAPEPVQAAIPAVEQAAPEASIPAPASPAPSAIAQALAPTEPIPVAAPKPVSAAPKATAPAPKPAAPKVENPATSVDFGKEITNSGRKEMTVRGIGADDAPTGDYVKIKQVSGRTGEFEVVHEYYAKPPGPENRYGHMETRNIGGTYTKAQAKQVAEGFLKGIGNPYEAVENGLPFSEYKPGNGNIKPEGIMETGFPHNTVPGGEDAWTDGKVAFISEAPGKLKMEGSQPDMTKVWTRGIKEADTPVSPVGFYQQAGEQKVVLSNQAGTHTLVDRKYFDYARKTFKDVSFAAKDNKSAIVVYSKDKPVGLIMPMRLEKGDLPAGIQPLLKAPK